MFANAVRTDAVSGQSVGRRDLSIDTLRGLACILLVAYHVVGSDNSLGLRLPDDHELAQLNNVLSYLRMPLFSFLSGCVYARRPFDGSAERFLKGKFRRLLVPLLIVGTVFALLQSVTPGANSAVENWWLLHIRPVGHYWFLESIFIVFLIVAALDRLRLLATPGRFACVWLVAAIIFRFNDLPNVLGLTGAFYLLPFFLFGLACQRFAELGNKQIVIGVVVGLCAYAVYLLGQSGLPQSNSIGALLLGVASCFLLLRAGFESRWLAAVGLFSFGIYLFHVVFTAASRIALTAVGLESEALLFSSGLLAGIIGPIVSVCALRRLPYGYLALGENPSRLHRLRHAQ